MKPTPMNTEARRSLVHAIRDRGGICEVAATRIAEGLVSACRGMADASCDLAHGQRCSLIVKTLLMIVSDRAWLTMRDGRYVIMLDNDAIQIPDCEEP